MAAVFAALAAGLLLPATGAAQVQTPTVTASFDYTPAEPKAGEEVTFRATSTSNLPAAIDHSWDLNGDGTFTDGEGNSVKTAFPQAGTYTVRLRARLAGSPSVVDVAERTVVVGGSAPPPPPSPTPTPPPANKPPVATYDKQCKKVATMVMCGGLVAREGVPKRLDASPSHDPDGSIVKYEWDLDGKAGFEVDAGTTPTTTHTFQAYTGLDPHERVVRLRVTDDKGATDVDEATLRLLEPACQSGMSHGPLAVKSVCIRKREIVRDGEPVTRWYSRDTVVVNGIAVRPLSHSTIVIDIPSSGATEIKANRAAVTVPVKGSAGTLLKGRVAWRVVSGRLQGFHVDGDARLNGLRITGMPSAPELLSYGTSKLDFYLALPQQFGGSTSDQPITVRPGATATTAASKPLSFEVANAAIGPIGLEHLKVTYDGVDLWEISAKVGLPEPIPYTVEGDAGIRAGEFEHAGAAVDFGSPGVGPFGPVFLQRIGFRVEIKPKKSKCVPHVGVEVFDQNKFLKDTFGWTVKPPLPDLEIDYGVPTFALCGDVKLSAGPRVLGVSAIGLDAGLGFATYDDRPAVFRAFGKVRLVEIPLADAKFAFHTDGYMKMHADFYWGIEDLASLSGFLNFEAMFPKFNAEAYVEACLEFVDWCAGAKALVSSKGVAVCLKIDVLVDDWEPGFGYRWGDTFPTLYFSSCDLGPYKEHIQHAATGARAAAVGDSPSIDLPPGLPGAVVALKGADAPPKVTLIGPHGERITTPDGLEPVQRSPFFVLKDPRAKLTQIAISEPAAGRWRIQVENGSSQIVSLRSAEGLDEPQVHARVVGRGHRRAIAYRIKPLKGQTVTFIEDGPSTGGIVGVAKGSRGRLRFTPADGRAERRDIVALVRQNGQVRDRIKVARYRAPSAQRPGRPSRLRLRRTRSKLTATWRAARGARRYQATVRLSDGRRLVISTRRHRLKVRRLAARTRGTVAVRALSAAGMQGRAAIARVPPKRTR